MSFINTIEDDSDQVELIVRQRFEAKPGCDIVGFDAYNQAGAVTQLSTDLESNSSRIDGIITSLGDTDASIVSLNTDLADGLSGVRSDLAANVVLIEALTADVLQDIENLASNVVLIEALRSDVDSNSASLLSVIEDVSSNALLIEALRDDVDSNASILVTTNERIDNVQESIGTVAQLQALMDGTMTDAEASALTGTLVGTLYSILQTYALKTGLIALEQTVNGLNFATNTAGNFFDSLDDFFDDDGNDTSTALQRQVLQNKNNIATHTNQISDLNSLAQTNADDVASLRNRTNDLSTKIVTEVWGQSVIDSLTYTTQEDLETALVNQPSRVDTLKTDYTALNSSVAGVLTSLATLTGDGEQAGEITQLRTDLTSNVGRLDTVIDDLASNSARISTVSDDLTSNAARISSLENSAGMSSGTGVDQLNTITKSLQITSGWMDTGIQGTDLTSGTHVVQIYDVDDHTAGGGDYDEIYSGIMSWFSGHTNSYEATEIHLTSAGHAPNDNHIYLRVLRTPYNNGTGRCKLQIRRDSGMSGSYTYTFKFRRLI